MTGPALITSGSIAFAVGVVLACAEIVATFDAGGTALTSQWIQE